jgi:amino acid adenylation domain-containing protein/non-ribosomal peptide synthase protein (TIGR01720 family)
MALSRLTGLSDIVIGTLMDLRTEQISGMTGPVENLVVLRSLLHNENSLAENTKDIVSAWEEASTFKTIPFDKLVLELNPKKDMSRTALFDIFYNYEAYTETPATITLLEEDNNGWGKYDFNLLAKEEKEHYELHLTYNALYFKQYTIEAITQVMERIVKTLLTDENTSLKEISLVSETAKGSVLLQDNTLNHAEEKNIITQFRAQVALHPEKTAVSFSDQTLTYKELDEQSNKLANFLISDCEIKLEDKVAIMLPKSDQLIVTIFAVLKSGAAYVPVDPTYPEERKSFMIEDAGCKHVIDENFLNTHATDINQRSETYTEVGIKGDSLAYIIYTSGTTGRPKGVMIEHGNVSSLLEACYQKFDFSENDTWSLFHSYCFDFSVWEIFGSLLSGGNVLVLNAAQARDHEQFLALMRKYNVSVFSQTPSAFYNFIDLDEDIPSLRYVVFGGESLHPGKLNAWHQKHPAVQLINMYGITETTVHVTYKLLDDKDLSSPISNIGTPLAFANCFILDSDQNLLPYGRQGELYISGKGVARGYINRPEIAATRFLKCPFDDHEVMYRTGDLARFLPSGELEYLGRIDDQVKIRGYRIELDEIKKHIDSHPGVFLSAVIVMEMPDGDKAIVAYMQLHEGVQVSAVKAHVASKVPEYMVPAFMIKMDHISINANGKIDKTKLPSPFENLDQEASEIISPTTETEKELFAIWAKLLNTEHFGVKHNFFNLGGHSLKAIRLISAIHKAFDVRLELKQLFANPTLEQQALLISATAKQGFHAIETLEDATSYTISDGQRRLWVLSQFGEASTAYNMASHITLEASYDINTFKKAIHATIDRHEILRTVFVSHEHGEVRQRIIPTDTFNFKINHLDLSGESDSENALAVHMANDKGQAFDLENGPLIRACIYKLSESQHVFYYNMHHSISDGWSMNILQRDVMAFYEAFTNNVTPQLPELRIQYKDYAAWQTKELASESTKTTQNYWLAQLSGELPVLQLPSSKVRPKLKTYNGAGLQSTLATTHAEQLRKFVQQQEGTLFIGLLTLWNVLLSRYTNEKDIILGSPVAGRDHADLENQIGFYINTLALRNQIDHTASFVATYKKVEENTLKALEHQMYPFDRLVEELNIRKDNSRNPVFDVMLTLQNAGDTTAGITKHADAEIVEVSEKVIAKFDIEIFFQEVGETLSYQVNYNTDVYTQERITGLMQHFNRLLEQVLYQPELPIGQIDFLATAEKQTQLYDYNNTGVDYDTTMTVVDRFEAQVEKTPEAIAVDYNGFELTYRELDEISNRFAYYLLDSYRIQEDDLVAVKLRRSEGLIVAILGILKSGGAYVPIDPDYPASRIEYIEQNSQCKVCVDDGILTNFIAEQFMYSVDRPAVKRNLNALAYVIYTSGSTGKPKGVMIEHRSLMNYLNWGSEYYINPIRKKADFGLFTSLSFDLTVTSIYLPLLHGNTLRILNRDAAVPTLLKDYFESDIPCIKLTPAHINVLGNMELNPRHKELAIVGGDALLAEHVNTLRKLCPEIRIINEYGPTEATVGCIVYDVKDTNSKILIGRPVGNTRVYILDENKNLLPEGATGELYISGNGLARGYLNRDDLTGERFIAHPYIEGERMYKTGDICRWLPGGLLEYIGREDDQVKIRGHRIELGEIEQGILAQPTINDVVVMVQEIALEKTLVAYVVSSTAVDKQSLRQSLIKILPDYMVPSYYVEMEVLPLTSNGKVDKASLPIVDSQDVVREEYVSARSEKEQALVKVWEEILQRDKISIRDNFYSLGGDSIKSIQVVSRLKEEGYMLRVEHILQTPILEELAVLMKQQTKITDQSVVTGTVALTPIQQYFFEDSGITQIQHYNQSVLLKSDGEINQTALTKSIEQLVSHHDALRLVYTQTETGWEQTNVSVEASGHKLSFHDLREEADQTAKLTELGEALQSSMDLEQSLFKIGHFRMSDGDRLVLILHHLVVDGVSWRILLEDLSKLYQGAISGTTVKLPLKTDSFQVWSSLQKAYAQSEAIASEIPYWQSITATELTAFPSDRKVGNTVQHDSREVITLAETLTNTLQTQVHKAYHTEINDILLTTLGMAIQDVFGVQQTLIELEGHGREALDSSTDITRTVGWFTSLYPHILSVDKEKSITEQLVEVKESLRKIPNKGIGYGMVKYQTETELQEINPTLQFNYLGVFGNELDGEAESVFSYSNEYIGTGIAPDEYSKVPLRVSGAIVSGALQLSIHYGSAQYDQDTMARLSQSYQAHLEQLIRTLATSQQETLTPSDLTYPSLSIASLAELNRKQAVADVYKLSPLQQGIYYHWLTSDDPTLYFEQLSYNINATNLDIDTVAQAYNILLSSYAVLRTGFTNGYNGTLLQVVYKEARDSFSYQEVADRNQIVSLKAQDRQRGFDLKESSQVRLMVVKSSQTNYEFIWSFHHIIMDGWCISIVVNDFYSILQQLQDGQQVQLPVTQPYVNYIKWLDNVQEEASLSYWEEQLSGYHAVATVPYKEKTLERGKPSSSELFIGGEAYQALDKLCMSQAITQNTLIQAVWGYLLSKYNNTNDVVFGTVVSGRPADLLGVEQMVGLFINTIPVRVQYKTTDTVFDLLQTMHQASIASQAHHYLNLSEVQSSSDLGMELINHLMVFENYAIQEVIKSDNSNLDVAITKVEAFEQSHYDFGIIIHPSSNGITIKFEYDNKAYREESIHKLTTHFKEVLTRFVNAPEQQLHTLEYLPKAENTMVASTFNTTTQAYPEDATLVSLFSTQVAKTPQAVALQFEEESLTYQALDELSNRFAHYLLEQYAIHNEDLVAVKLKRSEWNIIAILGILKAGGAYVPIDPDYPQSRIEYMESDSQCKACIDEAVLQDFMGMQELYSKQTVAVAINPEQLAYVIYTSGSTGNPKGVMIEHRNIINTILAQIDIFEVSICKQSLQFASFSFDASVSEIFITLCSGATLHVASDALREDPKKLEAYIEQHSIDLATIPPAYMKHIDVAKLKTMKSLVTAGEAPAYDKVVEYLAMNTGNYFNAYGPTEASICGTIARIDKGTAIDTETIPIGKPIHNASIYILNADNGLQAIGIEGEICIGGKGIARGYRNRPELTATKFIENPYKEGERLYKTGDLGYWLPNGEVVFIGRIDDQVKVNGYRIELGEIEASIQVKEDIRQAAVITIANDDGNHELAAYIVSDTEQNISEMRKFLLESLPAYMLPSHYVQLEELPVNVNGKVDRKALPLPADIGMKTGAAYVAPETETQERLIALLAAELKLDTGKIGVMDNFFDLGMNSLKLMKFLNRVNHEFQLDIKPVTVFQYPNINELTTHLFNTTIASEDEEDDMDISQEFEDIMELMKD